MVSAKLNRRVLARELSVASRANACEILASASAFVTRHAYRVGVTGPPGAGKSTLLAKLVAARLNGDSQIGVLAIDPSSPLSGGSILGDRIRMDDIADNPSLYIRSLPSGSSYDGLTGNAAQMLSIMDKHGFDEVFLETVGVGQIDHAVKMLVDTMVLVLVPESGDSIQAMKAGILEMADIYVVNKADRPNADRIAAEIESVLGHSTSRRDEWKPPVLMAVAQSGEIQGLSDALDRHKRWLRENRDPQMQRRLLARQQISSLLCQEVVEIAANAADELFDAPLDELMSYFIGQLNVDNGMVDAPVALKDNKNNAAS